MKIGIIGRIAENKDLYDGQTIKTRILKDALNKRFNGCEFVIADTYQYKKNMIKVLFGMIRMLFVCDCVFVLLSRRGRKVFFPIIYYLNKIFRKPVYHDSIGGMLAEETRTIKNWKKYINSFSRNWVELPSIERQLKELGVTNAETLPNFKNIKPLKKEELDLDVPSVFRFCTFSRVNKEKGTTIAANAVAKLNKEYGRHIAELYVYGIVEDDYREEFERIINENKETIFYGGKIDFNKSVENIKDYFMLLFPTTHPGEGFPGTIIDAYCAGLPVAASDWKYNPELIVEGETGFCYNYKNENEMYDILKFAVDNAEKVIGMKVRCIDEAHKYKADKAVDIIAKKMLEDIKTR